MSDDRIQVFFPPRADMAKVLDLSLVTLTEAIHQVAPDTVAGGILGGEFGYGARYENDVFVMRPYYWGDCTCGWEQKETAWNETQGYFGYDEKWVRPPTYEEGWKAFLKENPGHTELCSLELPNFRHKASGLTVNWYKWIGRDMQVANPNNVDVATAMRECLASVSASGAGEP